MQAVTGDDCPNRAQQATSERERKKDATSLALPAAEYAGQLRPALRNRTNPIAHFFKGR